MLLNLLSERPFVHDEITVMYEIFIVNVKLYTNLYNIRVVDGLKIFNLTRFCFKSYLYSFI